MQRSLKLTLSTFWHQVRGRGCGRARPARGSSRREGKGALEERGAELLFLPSYSPNYNPMKEAVSKFKAWSVSSAHVPARCSWRR
jgi:transposase